MCKKGSYSRTRNGTKEIRLDSFIHSNIGKKLTLCTSPDVALMMPNH